MAPLWEIKGKGAAARGRERWIVYCVTGKVQDGLTYIDVPSNLTMTERSRDSKLLDVLGRIV